MKVFDSRMVERAPKLVSSRRIKLQARALLFILLSLGGFAAITLSPTILSTLSGITVNYPSYVRLTNSIIAAICAAFLLWPREGGKLVGRWNHYAGVAFSTFFVFYSLRFLGSLLKHRFPEYTMEIELATEFVAYVGSYLNNIFFLAAARILLNKNRRDQETRSLTVNAVGWQRLKQEWVALRSALPNWYWIMLPVSMTAMAEWFYPSFLWARFPDAFFSIYCLSWFAYAVWLSFRVRRQVMLSWLGFVLILAYAAGQLVFAANPFIAYSVSEDSNPTTAPATWVRSYLRPKVVNDLSKITTQIHKDAVRRDARKTKISEINSESKATPDESFEGAKKFFDGATFAILFPMKTLLFLPVFILYLLSLISVNDFRQALRDTTSKRMDYLSAAGILSAIGRSMKADEVRLIIRLPGVKRHQSAKEERVIAEVWNAPDVPPAKTGPRVFPVKDDDMLVRAMQTEGKEIIVTTEGNAQADSNLTDTGPQTLTLIPIKFHGGIIGVLRVIFRGYGKYNNGTLEQLIFMAELIAPSVQDFRTVSAVDKLGPRLTRAQASRRRDKINPGDRPSDPFQNSTGKMAETLYDLLNPLGIGLFLECGFTSVKPIFPKEGKHYEVLKRPDVGHFQTLKRPKADHGEAPPLIIQTDDGPVRIEHDQLFIRTEKGTPYDLGSLIVAIPHIKDEFAKPTLAAYYLTRRMVASLTADGIYNAARDSLGVIIQDLGVALNTETLSFAEWFEQVGAASKKSGFAWVVVSDADGTPLLGLREPVEIVAGLGATDKENLMSKPLGCIPHQTPASAHRHIIHLQLKEPGYRLLLGVERAEFGRELNFQSPWRVFLENLRNVAGAAIARIEDRRRAEIHRRTEETQRLREAEDEWLKTVADFSAMLMHQLVNMADNLLATAGDLLESVDDGPFAPDDQSLISITNMKKNAATMMEMTSAYNRVTEMGGPCACRISEAAEQARKLFQFSLRKKEIELKFDMPANLVARAPCNIVALALAALIYNAIDAIQSRGTIKIKAEANGDIVCCQVKNTGSRITDEIRPHLFRPGTKGRNGHSGRGLYYVSRSLKNYKGDIELSYSNYEETCFTFRLPVSSN